MKNTLRIRDLIIETPIEVLPDKKKESKARTAPKYEIVLENDSDFAIRRTTATTQKLLVCILSQGQIYIKDEKSGEIDPVIHTSAVTSFIKDCPLSELSFQSLQHQPFDFGYADKRPKGLFAFALQQPGVAKELAKNKVFEITEKVGILFKENPNKFLFAYSFAKEVKADWLVMCPILDQLEQIGVNRDKLRHNAEKIRDLDAPRFFSSSLVEALKISNCDFNTFIDYLLFDIKNDNMLSIVARDYYSKHAFSLADYIDYIRMQKEMFGRIKEKYPKNFLSDKQRLTGRYALWKKAHKEDVFLANSKAIQNLSFQGEKYSIVIPENTNDIIEEGHQLKHCVAAYVDRILEHQTNIVFMRLNSELDKSLVTVEIRENAVVQFRGVCNRCVTVEEKNFLISWAKEKGLDFRSLTEMQNLGE